MVERKEPASGAAAQPPVARQRLDAGARRAQLIGIGLELIRTRPIDQIVLDEVIERAGISNGLLFHYFATKRDYQLAVVESAAAELLAAVAPDRSLGVLDQLRSGIEGYLRYVEEHPLAYRSITRSAGSDEALLELVERIKDAIVDLVAWPITRDPDALLRLAIRGWIGGVEESALVWIRDRPCGREVLVDLLLRAGVHTFALAGRRPPGMPVPPPR